MKSAWIAWAFFIVHISCGAKGGSFGPEVSVANRLKHECGYDLGEEIVGSIVSEEVKQGVFHAGRYISFEFQINFGPLKKKTVARILFNCTSEGSSAPYGQLLTPAQLIQREDAGGRYFRHVAWQKKISGRNWSGLVAYSDYLFGDGQKSLTYTYLICPISLQCFYFEINPQIRLTSKEREAGLDLMRGISYKD